MKQSTNFNLRAHVSALRVIGGRPSWKISKVFSSLSKPWIIIIIIIIIMVIFAWNYIKIPNLKIQGSSQWNVINSNVTFKTLPKRTTSCLDKPEPWHHSIAHRSQHDIGVHQVQCSRQRPTRRKPKSNSQKIRLELGSSTEASFWWLLCPEEKRILWRSQIWRPNVIRREMPHVTRRWKWISRVKQHADVLEKYSESCNNIVIENNWP